MLSLTHFFIESFWCLVKKAFQNIPIPDYSHYKDKTVSQPFYLYKEIPIPGYSDMI